MLGTAALVIVIGTGAFLVALGASALFRPSLASAFLLSFASTPTKHYFELVVRFIIGCALVVHASSTVAPLAFMVFGTVLIATTTVMAFLPWHRHRAFASRSVPQALRYLPLVGIASVAGGVAILFFATTRGAA